MSPEQARSQPIDHRTDLYSVAVCLYEALTAERLFVGDLSTPADVIYSQTIVPPSQKRKGLPTALDVVLSTALSPDPADRYQDSVAFADALRQVAHRHGLLYSAPQLGEHLRHILGSDPQNWLTDDKPGASGNPSTQKIPAKELEGKEAASIGVVEASSLYVMSGNDIVDSPVPPKSPKSEPISAPAAPDRRDARSLHPDRGRGSERCADPRAPRGTGRHATAADGHAAPADLRAPHRGLRRHHRHCRRAGPPSRRRCRCPRGRHADAAAGVTVRHPSDPRTRDGGRVSADPAALYGSAGVRSRRSARPSRPGRLPGATRIPSRVPAPLPLRRPLRSVDNTATAGTTCNARVQQLRIQPAGRLQSGAARDDRFRR